MIRSRPSQILAWSLGLGLAVSTGAYATNYREAALGSGGELFQVTTGTYGALFPGGRQTAASNPVLGLDIARPGEAVERILVPGTEEADVESSPYILVEGSSNTVFLVWEIRINDIHSLLRLASFDGTSWSTPIHIGKNPFSLKTAPQLAITHDTYRVAGTDGAVHRKRTILHLIWAEEEGSAADSYRTWYTPLIIEEGKHVGSISVYDLNEFHEPASFAATAPAGGWTSLARTPTIQSGRDDRTVVVAFGDPDTRSLVTLEIDSLPAELSMLADPARAQIVDLGRRMGYPAKFQTFAESVHKKVQELGDAFQPEVARAIANRVREVILEGGAAGQELRSVADGARAQIVDLGAKLSRRGLRSTQAMSSTGPTTLSEVRTGPDEDPEGAPPHLILFSEVSNRPAPEVGNGEVRMFVSESGEHLILAWQEGNRMRYRSSQGEGTESWSGVREIVLGGSLDLEKAYEILRQRARNL